MAYLPKRRFLTHCELGHSDTVNVSVSYEWTDACYRCFCRTCCRPSRSSGAMNHRQRLDNGGALGMSFVPQIPRKCSEDHNAGGCVFLAAILTVTFFFCRRQPAGKIAYSMKSRLTLARWGENFKLRKWLPGVIVKSGQYAFTIYRISAVYSKLSHDCWKYACKKLLNICVCI